MALDEKQRHKKTWKIGATLQLSITKAALSDYSNFIKNLNHIGIILNKSR